MPPPGCRLTVASELVCDDNAVSEAIVSLA
jgi:hypothetical protein